PTSPCVPVCAPSVACRKPPTAPTAEVMRVVKFRKAPTAPPPPPPVSASSSFLSALAGGVGKEAKSAGDPPGKVIGSALSPVVAALPTATPCKFCCVAGGVAP